MFEQVTGCATEEDAQAWLDRFVADDALAAGEIVNFAGPRAVAPKPAAFTMDERTEALKLIMYFDHFADELPDRDKSLRRARRALLPAEIATIDQQLLKFEHFINKLRRMLGSRR